MANFKRFWAQKLLVKVSKVNKRNVTSNAYNYSDHEAFRKVLNDAHDIVVMTGTDFSKDGCNNKSISKTEKNDRWRNFKVEHLSNIRAFKANPSLVWEFYNYRRNSAFRSYPNKVHLNLADFERKCKRENKEFNIITNNVDGLHIRAGSQNVLELHGSLRKVICTNNQCKTIETVYDDPIVPAFKYMLDPALPQSEFSPIDENQLPKCRKCGCLVRPNIVWFGEKLDTDKMLQVSHLLLVCDLLIIIGTSLSNYPAVLFGLNAAKRGIPVAEFSMVPFSRTS
ncbi:NAD-dependent protein deacylase-like isoform X2 [Agrilus planipennis]|uniref:NAD-dependent protein deacylase-like isoform X2 n=1 Tax=Agrilus planipennis TaxID=224129 RepID=A0A1W4XMT4_AGRPL|nr:NAD-dependent protein deacylase-like isoform X2 [Agrilus planipennis]